MKARTALLIAVVLASAAIRPQPALAQMHPSTNLQMNEVRSQQMLSKELSDNNHLNGSDSVVRLKEHRARLAQAWQTLGLSPEAARTVAAAYRLESARNSAVPSLRGKSGHEVAALLQTALANKDYVLANQMLIAYQGQQMRTTSKHSAVDRD